MNTIDNTHYLSRSWAMLTKDKGWFKPILLLALIPVVMIVPVVGWIAAAVAAIGQIGYQLEWARLTSWGVDSTIKQKGVDVGGCLKAGWRGFVVSLGWAVLIAVIGWLLRDVIFSFNESVSGFIGFVWYVLTLFIYAAVIVAMVRATIYQSFGAGYQFNRIWDMVKHDFGGIARITGIMLLGEVIEVLCGIIMAIVVLSAYLPAILTTAYSASAYSSYSSYSSNAEVARLVEQFMGIFQSIGPVIVLLLFVLGFIASLFGLLATNAAGLYLRQFDVRAWGPSAAPLPAPLTAAGGKAPAPAPFVAQAAPSARPAAAPTETPVATQANVTAPVAAPTPAPVSAPVPGEGTSASQAASAGETTTVTVQPLSYSPDDGAATAPAPEQTAPATQPAAAPEQPVPDDETKVSDVVVEVEQAAKDAGEQVEQAVEKVEDKIEQKVDELDDKDKPQQ